MADREYKIELKIEGDASGSAPVDAGLKRVEEGAKRAEDALKQVEDQSRRTDQAVSSTGSKSPGAAFGVGSNGLPLPDKVRSWHSPEEAAAIERMAGSMRTVTTEAAAMEGAAARAGVAVTSLGTGAAVAGAALVALPIYGARKEFSALGEALADVGNKLARKAAESSNLSTVLQYLTNKVKDFSGATAEERGEEQKLTNAKLDTALARQKVINAAADEKEAIEQVTAAIANQITMIEKRNRRLAEGSKTDAAVEEAGFDNERAKLANTPGLTREERVTKEADIDRRQLEARQARQKADLERERAAANAKLEEADKIVAEAEKDGNPGGIKKARERRDAVYSSVHDDLLKIRGDQARLEKVGALERDSQAQRSEANIQSAREQDSREIQDKIEEDVSRDTEVKAIQKKYKEDQQKKKEKEAAQEERESMARAKRLVVGDDAWQGSFDYNTKFPSPFNNASDDGQQALRGTRKIRQAVADGQLGGAGNEDTMALVGKLEQAAAGLADGVATGEERKVFNDALLRLANAISRIAPGMASGLRDLRQEIEPRLKKIEEDIAIQNMGSTK